MKIVKTKITGTIKDSFNIQCFSCKHYTKKRTCIAFKGLIPEEIFKNEHDHRKPFKWDNGIRFEPLSD